MSSRLKEIAEKKGDILSKILKVEKDKIRDPVTRRCKKI